MIETQIILSAHGLWRQSVARELADRLMMIDRSDRRRARRPETDTPTTIAQPPRVTFGP
jgi:hypothetical protein